MYNRWKFTVLLTALLLLLVVHPLIWGGTALPLLYYGLFVVVMLAVILALYQRKQLRIAALALGVPTVVGILAIHGFPAAPPALAEVFLHLLPALFIGYTVVTILRLIFQGAGVTADEINGAFCGYLLLGIAFGHVYCLMEWYRPGSFNVPAQLGVLSGDAAARHSLLTYFSLVTLTTVGYGDITPTNPAARSLACIEAVAGQFYVAVVIAELIGLKLAAAMREPRPAPPTAPPSRDAPA